MTDSRLRSGLPGFTPNQTLNFVAPMALLLILVISGLPSRALAEVEGLNGTWQLDEAASENLEDVSAALNKKLNQEWRNRNENKFSRDVHKPKQRNRFHSQMDATEKMINEDNRSVDWAGSDESRTILTCTTIKLYQSRKVLILYDSTWKRSLKINPAGRAFSVKGQEITTDDLGRVLTFFADDSLVIETAVHSGGKLTETYRLDGSAKRMSQHLSVQERVNGPALEMTRYFDRIQ